MGKFDKAGANKAFEQTKKVEQEKATVEVLVNVRIENLIPCPDNNKDVSYTLDIEESIRAGGWHGNLIVTDYGMEKGKYMIVAGHRRVEAAKKVGLEVLPCKVVQFENEIELRGVVRRDNFNRLNWAKESDKWVATFEMRDQLKDEKYEGNVAEALAKQFNTTTSTIYRWLAMEKIIKSVWEMIDNGEIKFGVVQPLAQMSEEEQNSIYSIMQEAVASGVENITKAIFKEIVDGFKNGKNTWVEIKDMPRDSGLPLNGFINTEPTESREPNEDGNRNDEVRREFDPIAAEYDQMDADRKAWEEEQESAEEAEDDEKEEKHELSPEEKYMKNGVELAKQLKKIDTIMQDIWKCETEEDARNMIINMSSVAQAFVDEMYRLADEHSIKEEAEKAFTDMKNAVEQYI